jgi:hypothetical protein
VLSREQSARPPIARSIPTAVSALSFRLCRHSSKRASDLLFVDPHVCALLHAVILRASLYKASAPAIHILDTAIQSRILQRCVRLDTSTSQSLQNCSRLLDGAIQAPNIILA